MGDRANVAIKDRDARVYLYTHWSGSDAPEIVRAALTRGEDRWSDAPYLARVVFCEMVKGSEGGTTGFGISTKIGDNEYPIIVVDCDTQEIYAEAEEYGDVRGDAKRWPFSDYAGLDGAEWKHLDTGR